MNSINSQVFTVFTATKDSRGRSVCLPVNPWLTERGERGDVATRVSGTPACDMNNPQKAYIHVHTQRVLQTLYSWYCSEATISASLRHYKRCDQCEGMRSVDGVWGVWSDSYYTIYTDTSLVKLEECNTVCNKKAIWGRHSSLSNTSWAARLSSTSSHCRLTQLE